MSLLCSKKEKSCQEKEKIGEQKSFPAAREAIFLFVLVGCCAAHRTSLASSGVAVDKRA